MGWTGPLRGLEGPWLLRTLRATPPGLALPCPGRGVRAGQCTARAGGPRWALMGAEPSNSTLLRAALSAQTPLKARQSPVGHIPPGPEPLGWVSSGRWGWVGVTHQPDPRALPSPGMIPALIPPRPVPCKRSCSRGDPVMSLSPALPAPCPVPWHGGGSGAGRGGGQTPRGDRATRVTSRPSIAHPEPCLGVLGVS